MDDDIILEVHLNLKKIDPTMQGLQDPLLGPFRQFRRVSNPFVWILHRGNHHWVCISSTGCSDSIVNLYGSLYQNVISKEVEDQAINLVGADSFSGLNVVPIQQQRNGSDCGVFAAAFVTALVHGVPASLLEFDTTKLRNHLCECLKAGKLENCSLYCSEFRKPDSVCSTLCETHSALFCTSLIYFRKSEK